MVEEGTDDQELNVAVGHDAQSVWPGVDGTAVFLAATASDFVTGAAIPVDGGYMSRA